MKKYIGLLMVGLLAVALTAAPAKAYTFEKGDNLGKFSDYASFYLPNEDGTAATPLAYQPPAPGGSIPAGLWDQTIFTVTSLYQPPAEIPSYQYYSGSNPELLGMVYDLQVLSSADSTDPISGDAIRTIALGAAGRYSSLGYSGGRMDIWQNTATDYNPLVDPANWGYGSPQATPFAAGGYDTFPTINGAADTGSSPLLSGTLVSPNGTSTLLTITLDLTTGTGYTSQGYIALLYNATGMPFGTEYINGYAYNISFFENFKFYPNTTRGPGVGTTANTWNVHSQDPITFSIVPEPATMSLLGMALIGLGGSVLRKWRK
jgi:hypothetical protein